jgi:hypothetical protein
MPSWLRWRSARRRSGSPRTASFWGWSSGFCRAGLPVCLTSRNTTAVCAGLPLGSRACRCGWRSCSPRAKCGLADGTLLCCANYPDCAKRSHFAGHAAYGYSPSKSQLIWGMRLVVFSDLKGVPVGYELVGPKTGQEREAVVELACRQPGTVLFCDKGLWGRELNSTLQLIDVKLITPERHRLGQRPPSEVHQARIRLAIESLSPTSNARCASAITSPRPWPGPPSASPNACSRSPSQSSATYSSANRPERSSPMTAAEPT